MSENPFGLFLRGRRGLLGITQKQAGERAGASQQTWARWESGRVPLGKLPKIAAAIEVASSSLVELLFPETSSSTDQRRQADVSMSTFPLTKDDLEFLVGVSKELKQPLTLGLAHEILVRRKLPPQQ